MIQTLGLRITKRRELSQYFFGFVLHVRKKSGTATGAIQD